MSACACMHKECKVAGKCLAGFSATQRAILADTDDSWKMRFYGGTRGGPKVPVKVFWDTIPLPAFEEPKGTGCPCEPHGLDGLRCPDENGCLLCAKETT